MMVDYSENTFNSFNKYCSEGIADCLEKFNTQNKTPVILCIGSDLVLGDSLGPLVGTMLRKKNIVPYVYGTLNYPLTAKEIEYARLTINNLYYKRISIVIDAGVGVSEDVGLIKIINKGIKPGLGVNKNINEIGDIGIIGFVAEKSKSNYNLLNITRLNLIYRMAENISNGIEQYLNRILNNNSNYNKLFAL